MRFKPYPKYKPSGVEWLGDVPEGWIPTRLKYVAEFRYGDSLASEIRIDGEVKVFGSNGPVGTHISANTEAPAIIVGRKGSYGKVTYSTMPAFAIDTTYFVDARCTRSDLRWLFYGLQTLKLDEFSQDTGVPGLSREDAYSRTLAVPSPTAQSRIANFLDLETAKIDTLINKQEKLIELLKEKRQAVISHAVTKGLDPTVPMKDSGVEWLGPVPAHWLTTPLKHIMTMSSGGTPSKDRPDFWDGAYPWASAKDLKVEVLEDTQDHISEVAISEGGAALIEPGAVLIVVRGMILLHTLPVTVNAVPMAINQDLKALRSKSICDSGYLAVLLRGLSKEILGRTDQAAHGTKALREGDWTGMLVPLPPLEEQIAVAKHIASVGLKIDTLIAKAEQAIALQKEHRTALISAAVTGKIDVRNEIIKKEVA